MSGSCSSFTCGRSSSLSNRAAWGFPCSYDYDCTSYQCSSTTSKCVGKTSGQSCSYNFDCGAGLTCVGTGSAATCMPVLRLGEYCSASSSQSCVPYGVCDTTLNKCVPLFTAGAGSRCTSTSQCAVPYRPSPVPSVL
jgi:hypothetical protein